MNEIDRRFLLGGLAGAAGASALAGLAKAGPLNPPGGSVAASGKTTQELFDKIATVEPRIALNAATAPGGPTSLYIISQSGSYYLTGNVDAGTKLNAIVVTAIDVTIDLNGFSVANYTNSGNAISSLNIGSLIVRNGTIVAAEYGVQTGANVRLMVENILFRECHASVEAAGAALIRTCFSYRSTAGTIGLPAFRVGPGSLVSDCTVHEAGNGSGIFATAPGCIVDRCAVNGGTTGITASGVVSGCAVSGFFATGISAADAVVEGNSVQCDQGVIGIAATGSCHVRNNRVRASTAAAQTGISLAGNNNSVSANSVTGFSQINAIGIKVENATGTGNSGNRITDNEIVDSWRHIYVGASYNFIVRNTMSFTGAGGNFSAVANNVWGPFVNCTGGDMSAIGGTSHPQANLSY